MYFFSSMRYEKAKLWPLLLLLFQVISHTSTVALLLKGYSSRERVYYCSAGIPIYYIYGTKLLLLFRRDVVASLYIVHHFFENIGIACLGLHIEIKSTCKLEAE